MGADLLLRNYQVCRKKDIASVLLSFPESEQNLSRTACWYRLYNTTRKDGRKEFLIVFDLLTFNSFNQ